MSLHPLLKRQLKRLGLSEEADSPTPSAWRELLQRVSRAYEEHDQERYLLERSQDLASDEMTELYATLRAERDQLEQRVHERTDALSLSEGRLQSLVSLSADWIWEQDEELRFTYMTDVAATTGVDAGTVLGKRREWGGAFSAPEAELSAFQATLAKHEAFRNFSYCYTRADGTKRYVRISGEPVFDGAGKFCGYRGVGSDVTQATLAEQKVQELARFDSVTGLANRHMFMEELERAIARAARLQSGFAVLFIDLDRFKTVNDTLGHAAGDTLLKHMARRLSTGVRQTDLVARLGGDEFVVLLEGDMGTSNLWATAHKLLAALGEPVAIEQSVFTVTGSVGVAAYPAHGQDAATLLKHADAAMYLAKDKGKNNVQFYSADLADLVMRQFEVEAALRLALTRNELVLHYQPKFDVSQRRLAGMEALVRWIHPTRGLVPPNEFIPVAEERGLIVPLGRWVMQAACRQISEWRAAGLNPPAVAVNLSARQFASDTLLTDLQDALNQYGLAPSDLEIELTESALMADPPQASRVLHQMDAMGIRISIDDFGTGYSSLAYLKQVPAYAVKIDRTFIDGLPHDGDDASIAQAVVALAHSLGLIAVAEGVETEAQFEHLKALGCDQAQGYLLGRPVAAAALAAHLSPARV